MNDAGRAVFAQERLAAKAPCDTYAVHACGGGGGNVHVGIADIESAADRKRACWIAVCGCGNVPAENRTGRGCIQFTERGMHRIGCRFAPYIFAFADCNRNPFGKIERAEGFDSSVGLIGDDSEPETSAF